MAFADQLKNLFKKRTIDESQDSRLSLAAPDVSLLSMDEDVKSVPADSIASASNSHLPEQEPATRVTEQINLPLLGNKTVAQHQRILSLGLAISVLALGAMTWLGFHQSTRLTQQIEATGQALLQSQRLTKVVSGVFQGDGKLFSELAESSLVLSQSMRAMQQGNAEPGLIELADANKPMLESAMPLVERADKSVAVLLAQQKTLIQFGSALGLMGQRSNELLLMAEALTAMKLQQNAPAAEIAATGQLAMLTQRIGKLTHEFTGPTGISQPALILFSKDLNLFLEIVKGLQDGHAERRLTAAADSQVREQLAKMTALFEPALSQLTPILANSSGLLKLREAQMVILTDSDALRKSLESLQAALSEQVGLGAGLLVSLLLCVVLVLLSASGLSRVQLQDSRLRQLNSEEKGQLALRHEQEAKRVNDANQAAILRLMNELQTVAEGDLTQVATVTEDITGAIADSVNYTVEELRSLVGNVQSTAARVAQTTSDVDMTSTELLAASNEQLHEIRETGRSIVEMATRMNQVSAQAQSSAQVARQSLRAAETGLQAVQDSIGGMNTIRDQIQETAKRIKRLGESSQEIGEMTELISDITEQTNVLALNAAIQAASAGEAGRGFSVVAEEVQRLAERSADATRQIAALVRAIQTDTQDAVGAMERSTQGVVEGAKLSDNAGTALSEIDQVSRRLAELIEQISDATSREANLANEVAGDIQHIFAVTEQTGEGTRSTAAQVRELSQMAEELRQSVARFRIA